MNTPSNAEMPAARASARENHLEHLEGSILGTPLVVFEAAEEERRVPCDLGMLLEKTPEHRIRLEVIGAGEQ
jgi:hypothetical protein